MVGGLLCLLRMSPPSVLMYDGVSGVVGVRYWTAVSLKRYGKAADRDPLKKAVEAAMVSGHLILLRPINMGEFSPCHALTPPPLTAVVDAMYCLPVATAGNDSQATRDCCRRGR